ncbi:hypothetical protein DFH06DRAFT_123494 [Mycena polygramma]|nr:hypothetical protein DFH06DRAFT_123494 [Mycena polygramma]
MRILARARVRVSGAAQARVRLCCTMRIQWSSSRRVPLQSRRVHLPFSLLPRPRPYPTYGQWRRAIVRRAASRTSTISVAQGQRVSTGMTPPCLWSAQVSVVSALPYPLIPRLHRAPGYSRIVAEQDRVQRGVVPHCAAAAASGLRHWSGPPPALVDEERDGKQRPKHRNPGFCRARSARDIPLVHSPPHIIGGRATCTANGVVDYTALVVVLSSLHARATSRVP